jgi:hypothetical protein
MILPSAPLRWTSRVQFGTDRYLRSGRPSSKGRDGSTPCPAIDGEVGNLGKYLGLARVARTILLATAR